jgi:Ca2+-binding RTX toxin-like protein
LGQVFTPTGVKVGNEFLVSDSTTGNQIMPAVAALPDGDFIVSWRDAPGTAGSFYAEGEIRAQLFGGDGTKLGSQFTLSVDSTTGHSEAKLAAFGSGDVAAVWMNSSSTLRAELLFSAVQGTEGPDTITGTQDRDFLFGLGGNDRLDGAAGNDTLDGGDGDDILTGGAGQDVIDGGNGNDVLFSHDATPGVTSAYFPSGLSMDTLAEHDVLHGGAGDDVIFAGYGDDVDGGPNDYIGDKLAISFLGATSGVTADFRLLGSQPSITIGGGTITGIEEVTAIEGSNYDDFLAGWASTSYPGGNSIYGRGGNDHIIAGYYAGWGGRAIYGGDGDDVIDLTAAAYGPSAYGEAGNDTIIGGSGYERLDGGIGNDTIYGNYGFDTLIGGDGDDLLDGGNFDDSLDGGNGNDILYGAGDLDSIRGGAGDDIIYGDQSPLGSSNGLSPSRNDDVLSGEDGNDTIYGDWGNDHLDGGAGNDLLDGGTGQDAMAGGTGNDIFYVDDAGDTVTENVGEGTDEVRTGLASYQLGANVEKLTGLSSAGQTLTGNGLDNVIAGNSGNDMIDVGTGIDRADGGAGIDGLAADLSIATTAININLVANTYSGPTGTNFTNFEYLGSFSATNFQTGSGNDIVVTANINRNDTVILGAGDDAITLYNGSDNVQGGVSGQANTNSGLDTLILDYSAATGNVHASQALQTFGGGYSGGFTDDSTRSVAFEAIDRFVITTGSGDDVITTGDGDDIVDAGAIGSDTIKTQGGNDIIYVHGIGADTADAGTGTDTLVVNFSQATLAVFDARDPTANSISGGWDGIFYNSTDGGNVFYTSVERFNITGGSGDDNITTADGNDQISTGAGDDVLNGAAGDDLLDGGVGADHMTGGLGNDIFYVDNTGDVVTENAGEGTTDEVRTTLSSYTLAPNVEILTGTGAGFQTLRGNGADNVITAGSGGGFLRLEDGGADTAKGLGGNDVFLFGATLTSADKVDGGAGRDQIAIQGDYWTAPLTLGANVVNTESLAILPGSDTRFGDPGTNFYDYNLTMVDANVAAGVQFIVDANRLRVGEDFTFDGSAESDGRFFIYGGGGTDNLKGGMGNDAFYFGENGQFGATDHVDGGPGGIDQLGLRGSYTIVFGATQLVGIENIGMVSALDTRFGPLGSNNNYDLTMNDGNVLAGQQMTVDAAALRSTETLTFNGSAERDGSFRVFGGAGNDHITGSLGNDILVGGKGADLLDGGAGADIFRYRSAAESSSIHFDTIDHFDVTQDVIDLPVAVAGWSGTATVTHGALSNATFDSDLAAAIDVALDPSKALLFTADSGTYAGQTFLVVDANGDGSYQADQDFVIHLTNPIQPIPTTDTHFLV